MSVSTRFILSWTLGTGSRILSGGIFLTGFLLLLNASDLLVGLMGSVNAWTLLLSLLASYVVERTRRRKRLLLTVVCMMRLLSCVPVLFPLIVGFSARAAHLVVICVLMGHCIFSIHTTDANLYMLDTLGGNKNKAFLYRRLQYMRGMEMLCLPAGGLLVDCLGAGYEGYLLLFGVALMFGLGEIYVLAGIHGPADVRTAPLRTEGFFSSLPLPWKHAQYRRFLIFSLAFFTCYYMVVPYQSLYLLKYVNLPTSIVSAVQTAQGIFIVLCSRWWGKKETQKGSAWVLKMTALLLPLDFGLYALVQPGRIWPLALAVCSTGFAGGGFWVGILSYRYELMPQQYKSVFEAWNGISFAAASLLGTLLGAKIQTLFAALMDMNMENGYRLMFVLAGCMCIAVAAGFCIWKPQMKGEGQ